jgi:hypothetical protein
MAAELKRQRETRGAAGGARPKPAAAFDPLTLGKLFLDQMHVYKAYWRDDPRFDATNTHHAVPGLPAPALDEETIRRLCRFAIANNFRWPPPGRGPRPSTARAALAGRLGPATWSAPRSAAAIGLAATGAGGGQWTLAVDDGRTVSLHVGLPASSVPTVWVAADALERLLAGVANVEELCGRLLKTGPARRRPAEKRLALGRLDGGRFRPSTDDRKETAGRHDSSTRDTLAEVPGPALSSAPRGSMRWSHDARC